MNWDGILALIATAVSGIIGVLTWVNHRHANRTTEEKVESEKTHTFFADQLEFTRYIDERVEAAVKPVRDALVAEQHARKVRDGAFARILRAIAAQWSGEGGPDLDPADIAEVEDTVPPHWVRGESGAPKRS